MVYNKDDLKQFSEDQILELLNKKNSKPIKLLSKKETFQVTIETLEKKYDDGIPGELIILELEKTGVFTNIQARNQLDKYYQAGYLYEPKPGFFKRP